MTKQRRTSKSQYLNAMRKLGFRPSKGYVYRPQGWMRRFVFRMTLRKENGRVTLTAGAKGLGEWTLADVPDMEGD